MRHRHVHLRPALLTHRAEHTVQRRFQFCCGQAWQQRTTHRLTRAFVLHPVTGANLPQVQRHRPPYCPRQRLQMTPAAAHPVAVGALLGIHRPDHAVEGTPTGQATELSDHLIVQCLLHAATPQQHGALVFQPMVRTQAGGNGRDLLGFADDEQEADFATPEKAAVGTQGLEQWRNVKFWVFRQHQTRVLPGQHLVCLPLIAVTSPLQLHQQTGSKMPDRCNKNDQQESKHPVMVFHQPHPLTICLYHPGQGCHQYTYPHHRTRATPWVAPSFHATSPSITVLIQYRDSSLASSSTGCRWC
ncbi:hypothetical protein D3C85_704000 [compost metagenome]